MIQLLSDAMDFPPEMIEMPFPDTNEAPYDLKTAGSRTTFTMGTALRRAADKLRQGLDALASEQLDVPPEDLIHKGGRVGVPDTAASFRHYGDVLRDAGQSEMTAEGVYQSENGLSSLDPETGQGVAADHWHQGAVGVEVDVDLETGKLEILRCHGAAYAGRIVNPHRVRQQNEGGIIFALGQALFEEIHYDGGSIVNPNLSDYMIPSILDIPRRLTSSALESEQRDVELHGVGEMVVPAVAPAIANAIFRATGVRIRALPMTPEQVLRALKAQTTEAEAAT
jgi:CO/xanthine dehydrogenase Mo-binding subunit